MPAQINGTLVAVRCNDRHVDPAVLLRLTRTHRTGQVEDENKSYVCKIKNRPIIYRLRKRLGYILYTFTVLYELGCASVNYQSSHSSTRGNALWASCSQRPAACWSCTGGL